MLLWASCPLMTYLAFDALCFADCVAAARRWVGGGGGGGGRHSWAGVLSWREGHDQQASSPPAWRLTCCCLPTSCCGRRHDVRLHMTCRGEGSGDYLMVSIAEMHFDIPSKCGDGRLSPVPTSRCESVVVPSLHTMMQLW